jgi:hypothetical protein
MRRVVDQRRQTALSCYVLRGDAILRVSVGGPESEAQKLTKSKRLARRIVGRL